MQSHDFEDLLKGATEARKLVADLFEEVTGEELDLEAAVKHYPLLALVVAAGAGAAAGWWVARKRLKQLPPPKPEPRGGFFLEGIGERIEEVLPGAVDRVREKLPEIVVSDEVRAAAKTWYDSAVEPKFKQNLESVAESLSHTRYGGLLKQAMQQGRDGQDVQLDDPEPEEPLNPV